MIPAVFFTFHVTLLYGPPSVPRSRSELFRHSVACRFLSGSLEYPATQLWSLILFPPLLVPPSEARSETRYRIVAFVCAAAFWAKTRATPASTTRMISKRIHPR